MTQEEYYRQQILRGIARDESPDYNVMYGGGRFNDYADHPRVYNPIMSGPNRGKKSSAAGKYQFLAGTWDDLARRYGYEDFSPPNQDAAAWELASESYPGGREAMLRDAEMYGVEAVLPKLSHIWTSLKGGIEENPRYRTGVASSVTPEMKAMEMNPEQIQTYRDALSASGIDAADLTDDRVLELMKLGGIPDAQDEESTMLADALRRRRNIDTPEGRTVRNGIYVAASPLEHFGNWVQRGRLEDDIEKSRERAGLLREQQATGRQSAWDAYKQRRADREASMIADRALQETSSIGRSPGTPPYMIARPEEAATPDMLPATMPDNRGMGNITDLYGPTGSPTTSLASDIGQQQMGDMPGQVYGPGYMNQSLEGMPNVNPAAMPGTGGPISQSPADLMALYQRMLRGG